MPSTRHPSRPRRCVQEPHKDRAFRRPKAAQYEIVYQCDVRPGYPRLPFFGRSGLRTTSSIELLLDDAQKLEVTVPTAPWIDGIKVEFHSNTNRFWTPAVPFSSETPFHVTRVCY